MCERKTHIAELESKKIQACWEKRHSDIARALTKLTWERISAMSGGSAYQIQNVRKLKLHRLKLWAEPELGFRCLGPQCRDSDTEGVVHLVWKCQDAQAHWRAWLKRWDTEYAYGAEVSVAKLMAIFSFQMEKVPRWLCKWASDHNIAEWDVLERVAQDLWEAGCAVMLTAIWRWNVGRKHDTVRSRCAVDEHASEAIHQVTEAMQRYRLTYYPNQ